MAGLGPASEGPAGLSAWARARVDPATAARPGCSQHRSTPVGAGWRRREPPAASSAVSAPAHISHNTCEEVAAGRLV